MSRRYSSLFQDTFENKRARLDVKVTSDVQINTNLPPSSSAGPSRAPLVRAHVTTNNDLWDLADDEDDHFVLLASQAAEAVEQGEKVQHRQNVDNSEISFSRFRKEVDSSTQVKRKSSAENVDFYNEALEDWSDTFKSDGSGEEPEELFKQPEKNVGTAVEHAHDIQMDYLQNELRKLKKDHEKLMADHVEMQEKYQTKDGEAATLRLELEQIRKGRITSQMKANVNAENSVKSLQAQIKEQDKIIAALEIEAKMKVAMERHDHFSTQNHQQEPPKDDDDIFKLNVPPLEQLEKYFQPNKDVSIFRCDIKHASLESDRRLTNYINDLQTLLADSLYGPEDAEESRIRNFYHVISKGVIHIKKFSLHLEFDECKDSQYIPALELRHLNDCYNLQISMERDLNLYQVEKIFSLEECRIARRFLAIVAFACEKLPLIDCLLEEIQPSKGDGPSSARNSGSIIKYLLEILHDVSYAKNSIGYLGFVIASAEILCGLANQIDKQEHLNMASDLFRMIIFARPQIKALLALSRFLLRITVKDMMSKFLEGLCHSSPRNAFVFDDVYKIQRFTDQSCVLQIFCALLESTCLEMYHSMETSQWYLDLVMELTLNMIDFFLECFGSHLQWISKVTGSHCDCYSKIGSSTVILMHFCLHHWLIRGMPQWRKLSLIAQRGVLLLYYIFGVNFKETVLKAGGHVVECRLQKVYNLTKNYHRQFQFKQSHRCAINTLGMHLIVPDPLCTSQSGETSTDTENNFLSDLAETFFETL